MVFLLWVTSLINCRVELSTFCLRMIESFYSCAINMIVISTSFIRNCFLSVIFNRITLFQVLVSLMSYLYVLNIHLFNRQKLLSLLAQNRLTYRFQPLPYRLFWGFATLMAIRLVLWDLWSNGRHLPHGRTERIPLFLLASYWIYLIPKPF